ncbi:hypothetical protein HPP92_026071 [Vanilla planifolia]|uniref:Uncharacterized protein n=1 Tax=Vanilla planifolia TaxID=51239 RepID=A0A835PHB9_VANPL|nr:hypothetical protein HPP92_026344 [Vanilla planifolia]KAG0451751.1 hypothetical protein HPP92_026071 [Vanilla planifolia]
MAGSLKFRDVLAIVVSTSFRLCAKRSLPNLPLLEPKHRENDAFLCAVKPCHHLHISCHGNLGGHLPKNVEDTMFGSVLIDESLHFVI